MVRILITGSNGMLGRGLSEQLAGKHELFGLDVKESDNSLIKESHFIRSDIVDGKDVLKAVSSLKPQFIIHTAAYTDVDGCQLEPEKAWVINAQGTKNIALAALDNAAILFYISTDFVFDGSKKEPYTEEDSPRPLNVYGRSKLEGEGGIREILRQFIIIRTSWLFGKGGVNFVDTIIKKAKEKKVLEVVDDQSGSPTGTKDLSRAIEILLAKINGFKTADPFGVYHISNSGRCSWYEFAKKIVEYSKLEVKVLPIASSKLNRPATRPKMSVMSHGRFEKLTGFKMRDWKLTLKEYIAEN